MLKVGVVGLGRMGSTHINNLKKISDVKLTAVCSVVESELEYYRSNGIEGYTSFEEMIDNAGLDMVIIAASAEDRPTMVRYAIDKGVHTFAEKPLGIRVEDIERILDVDDKNVKFQVGFMRRFDEDYAYAKEIIDSGSIGEITYIRAYGIDPADGLESFVKFAKNSNSGGIYHDMAIHDVDAIRWLTGREFKQVWAFGSNFAKKELDEVGELETGIVQGVMDNNIMVHLVAGRNAPHGYQVETEIMGTKGWIRIAPVPEKNLVTIYDSSGVRRECSRNFPERFEKAFISEISDFVKCIKEDLKPKVTAKDALVATKVCLKCKESLEKNTIIEI
ncbi:MAG: Gfo/Idh/MocA family oxidoreductase [Gemella sp.]|nr:Gfo/Idh/MocA family oxidoreductase [Gemella sp.]